MARTELIKKMKAMVEKRKSERLVIRKRAATDCDAYDRWTELGHEIRAIETVIEEMEREYKPTKKTIKK